MSEIRLNMILRKLQDNCEHQPSCHKCDMHESGRDRSTKNICLFLALRKELGRD
jgi:hypothetical protein